jgi:hypothetical protein
MMKELSMLAYPFPAWNWRQPHDKSTETQPAVSRWLERIQIHVQRHWAQAIASDEEGKEFASPTPPNVILPAGESASIGHAMHQAALAKHRARQVVTAARADTGQLELDSWRVNADGSVSHTGTSGPHPDCVAQLDMARAQKFVIAYRTPAQELKLVSWDVSNTGAIYRAGESTPWPERVRAVHISAPQEDLLVTAAITRGRRLKLTSWRLQADASISACVEVASTITNVRAVKVVHWPAPGEDSLVATLARSGANQLVVQLWRIQPNGELRLVSQVALPSAATQLHAVVDEQGHLIMAMRTPAGRLRLIGWAVEQADDQLHLLFDTGEDGEPIRRCTLMSAPGGVFTAIHTTGRQLKVILWLLTPDGTLRRAAESAPHLVTNGPLLLCSELLDGNAPILAGTRTASGKFKLTTWQL